MTALISVVIVLAVLVLIGVIPLRVYTAHKGGAFALRISLGRITLFSLPRAKKEAKPSKKEGGKKSKKSKKKSKEKKFSIDFEFVRAMLVKLAKVPGLITLEYAHVDLIAAGANDPFKAVMLYGSGWAAKGMLTAAVHNAFRKVKDFTYNSDVDFEAQKDVIEFKAQIHIKLWQLVCFAAGMLGTVLKLALRAPKNERSKADGEE